jgi:hypothetical protein
LLLLLLLRALSGARRLAICLFALREDPWWWWWWWGVLWCGQRGHCPPRSPSPPPPVNSENRRTPIKNNSTSRGVSTRQIKKPFCTLDDHGENARK